MQEAGGSGTAVEDGERRRLALTVIAAVFLLVVVAIAVWAVAGRGSDVGDESAGKPEIEHAQPTEPENRSGIPTATAVTSATAGAGWGTGETGSPTGGAPGGQVAANRNPVVAYRLAGALYASAEDGTGAVRVTPSASGVFALSPDGRSLAYVDLSTRELAIVDVASGEVRKFGGAEQVTPVWSPDSSWVLFAGLRSSSAALSSVYRTDVLRARRAGGTPDVLETGLVAAITPDGRTIVTADLGDAQSGRYVLKVMRDGSSPRTLPFSGPVTGLATDGVRAFVAVSHVGDASQQAVDGIWVVPLSGGSPTRLTTAASTARPVETRSLMLSPDGTRLLFASTGDDGYSRAAVVDTAGGVPTELARRRDAYPLGWSADGSGVFFIEGNAWQGESTALVRTRPDGGGHTVVVKGAGI